MPAPPFTDSDEIVPLWEAAEFIAQAIKVDHWKALREIVEAASRRRIDAYGKAECTHHNDVIPAWVWSKIKRAEADLWIDRQGCEAGTNCDSDPDWLDRYSPKGTGGRTYAWFWSDVYVFRGDLVKLVSRLGRGADSPETVDKPAPDERVDATPAVCAMRQAYARLAKAGEITADLGIKARQGKVLASPEVKGYIREAGTSRGLSEDNFSRAVVKTDWPGKPQIRIAEFGNADLRQSRKAHDISARCIAHRERTWHGPFCGSLLSCIGRPSARRKSGGWRKPESSRNGCGSAPAQSAGFRMKSMPG